MTSFTNQPIDSTKYHEALKEAAIHECKILLDPDIKFSKQSQDILDKYFKNNMESLVSELSKGEYQTDPANTISRIILYRLTALANPQGADQAILRKMIDTIIDHFSVKAMQAMRDFPVKNKNSDISWAELIAGTKTEPQKAECLIS